MRPHIYPVFLFLIAFLMSCSSDSARKSVEQTYTDKVNLRISVNEPSGTSISPALLYIYSANRGTDGIPDALHSADENGFIEARLKKNHPVILRIVAAGHQPVDIFLPSTALNELTVDVIPSPLLKKSSVRPSVIGDFNNFDPFNKVEFELNENGLWTAEIDTEMSEIRYKVTGYAYSLPIHGTMGSIEADLDLQGLVSVLETDIDGKVMIEFDPTLFSAAERRAELRFTSDPPAMFRGIAKIYTAMQEQAQLAGLHHDNEELLTELFDEYLNHIEQIRDTFDQRHVEQAYRLAKARFANELHLHVEFIDQLLQDVESNSELWLLEPGFVHALFTKSSKMEPVSKSIWDIYRQHHYEEIQSEALYTLINFHYNRGEDEEWHEAHFELVRSYPNSKRINYSYREGFAPESVVHIGRFFPPLAFAPLELQSDSLRPAENSTSLRILYFWSFDDPGFEQQFDALEILDQRFSDRGIDIIPIALNEDRPRVQRFHEHRNHHWNAGLEKFTNPQIQVLGITSTPQTLFIDEFNRVLYHGVSILEDERLPDYVEDFYNN